MAEHIWNRFIPKTIETSDNCAHITELTAPDEALLTVLFYERFTHADLGRYSPAQIEREVRTMTQNELLTFERGGRLTRYQIPSIDAINATLIHETGHIEGKHHNCNSELILACLKARPDIARRYPVLELGQQPSVSKKFLAIPIILAGGSLLDSSIHIHLLIGLCLSAYLTALYIGARAHYFNEVKKNASQALHEWMETQADLSVVKHGTATEKQAFRCMLNQYYVANIFEHIRIYRTLSAKKLSTRDRFVRLVSRCHEQFQGVIYRIVIGHTMSKKEPSNFQEYYDIKWLNIKHINPFKRLQHWDRVAFPR